MELIPNDVRKKIENLIGQAGVFDGEQVIWQNISMTGMPQDDFMTDVYTRRAKAEAEHLPNKYRCFACGRVYDSQNEFISCMQDHLKDFMAGIPIEVLPEFEEEQLAKLPPEFRNTLEKIKRDGLLPNDTPTNEE